MGIPSPEKPPATGILFRPGTPVSEGVTAAGEVWTPQELEALVEGPVRLIAVRYQGHYWLLIVNRDHRDLGSGLRPNLLATELFRAFHSEAWIRGNALLADHSALG